ncbi:hypothetical protein AAG906_040753 [Vitis piasezkii]
MGFQGNNSTKLWYVDSGASNHMTNNPTALCHVRPYAGQSSIQTANGSSLPIAAIGDASSKFIDVFLAPQLSTNLISVGQLVDNNCAINFSGNGCVVQDQVIGEPIAKGPKVGRLYGFPSSSYSNSISASLHFPILIFPHATHMPAKHDCWRQAMQEEIAALEANHTWYIEPCPPTIVPLGCKWVYSVKVRSDGSLDRYKARLVALWNNQEYGVNYEETFAPVAKMTNVRTILALAASTTPGIVSLSDFTCQSKYDTSLFLRKSDMGIVVLLVYVDDIVITGSITLYLVSSKLISPRATSVDTPMELNVKLRKEEGDLLADPNLYRKLVGSLVYLTITRPDISFAIQQVSQFLQTPRHLHLAVVRRIIRYVQGTYTRGLFFHAGNSTRLAAYSDADWAGCEDTCRAIIGWCVFLDRVSKSSTEFEYWAMSLACSEIIWLRGLLAELDFSETDPTPLHADNTSAIQITANPVYHERTKHIEVDCHSIREAFEARVITLPHIFTDLQIADIFTKALPRHRHCLLSSKLMLVDQPASI